MNAVLPKHNVTHTPMLVDLLVTKLQIKGVCCFAHEYSSQGCVQVWKSGGYNRQEISIKCVCAHFRGDFVLVGD